MSVIIPFEQLQPATLQAVIEEFVTRDGTFYGHQDLTLHNMVEAVRRQLCAGQAVIVFDETTETCTIVLRENRPPEPPEPE